MLRAIERALLQINGKRGDPRSFDKLDELLNAQSYRLAFWRVAAEEINYRCFFDVNDLAAIRVELPKVFDAVHRLVLELVGTGAVTGLRIDHPDGLYLPRQYSSNFRSVPRKRSGPLCLGTDARSTCWQKKFSPPPKRCAKTGQYMALLVMILPITLTRLPVDSSAETAITKTFHRFIGHSIPFSHVLYAKKLLVMKLALANDVDVLGNMP